MGLVQTTGIVTKEIKYGETSRIITLITKDYGKISAIANNVRTGKSRLLAGLSLFVYSEFVLYERKGKKDALYTVNEVNVIEPFTSIRESIEKMAYASYFADIVNKVTQENSPDEDILRLFLNSMYFLDNESCSLDLLKSVYEVKIADICGYSPLLMPCGACEDKNVLYIDPVEGKGYCEKCGRLLKKYFVMNNTVRDLWIYFQKSNLKSCISVKAEEEIIQYLNSLTEKFLSIQLECEFKTLKFLKNVMAI